MSPITLESLKCWKTLVAFQAALGSPESPWSSTPGRSKVVGCERLEAASR